MINWKFWKRKPAPLPVEDDEYPNPTLSFRIIDDGNIETSVWWPNFDDQDIRAEIISQIALLIHVVNSGVLLPHCQEAVVEAAQRDGMKDQGQLVLYSLNSYQKHASGNRPRPGRLVMRPTQVFKPTPQQD